MKPKWTYRMPKWLYRFLGYNEWDDLELEMRNEKRKAVKLKKRYDGLTKNHLIETRYFNAQSKRYEERIKKLLFDTVEITKLRTDLETEK